MSIFSFALLFSSSPTIFIFRTFNELAKRKKNAVRRFYFILICKTLTCAFYPINWMQKRKMCISKNLNHFQIENKLIFNCSCCVMLYGVTNDNIAYWKVMQLLLNMLHVEDTRVWYPQCLYKIIHDEIIYLPMKTVCFRLRNFIRCANAIEFSAFATCSAQLFC